MTNPRLRPNLCIINVAGTVVAAVARTITDTGSVAHASFVVSVAPIMPPNVTNTIAPVAEIS
jgi:hypothetical protein